MREWINMAQLKNELVSLYKGMRVAIYIRVSTLEQAVHGGSLEMQKDELLKWAKENGCIVHEIYVDDGFTATNLKRPALKKMLAEAENFDLIIFIKLDRFSRGVGNYYKIMERLNEANTNWKAIHEDYDTTTPDGRFKINMMLSFAEREAAAAGERTRAVFKHKIQNGECTFSIAPRGYTFSTEDGKRRLAIDKEGAKLIQTIFDHFQNFGSVRFTQTHLIEEHGITINYTLLRNLLSNKMYIGIYEHKEHGEFDNFCPVIIQPAQFFAVQRMLEKNAKKYPKEKKHTYIFSGLLRCCNCGRRLSGGISTSTKNGKKYRRKIYRCPNSANERDCPHKYPVPERKVEKFLLENVRALLEDRIITYNIEKEKAANSPIVQIEGKIKKLENRMAKLKDLFYDDLIEKSEYEQDFKKFKQEISDLRAKQEQEKTKEEHFDIDLYRSFLEQDFENIYASLSEEDRRRLWLSVVDNIVIAKDHYQPVFF